MEKRVANQFVLYENDAVLVSYTNGAGLQLSPCGSAFMYYHPLREGEHPLHGQKKIQQRTEFVTSTFKDSVTEALDFRNRFAERPFLCKSVIDSRSLARLHADICEIAWPEKLHKGNIQLVSSGAVVLSSVCEFGKLTISPSRQHFSVECFCRVSQTQSKQRWTPTQQKQAPSKTQPPQDKQALDRTETLLKYCVKTPQQEAPGIGSHVDPLSQTQWDYAWVTQHFSVDCYPEVWQHPLYLALEATQHKKSVTFEAENRPQESGFIENEENNDEDTNSIHVEEKICDNEKNSEGEEADLVTLAFKKLEMNEDLECISQISSIKSTEDGNQSTQGPLAGFGNQAVVTSLKQCGDKGLTNCVFSSVPKSLTLNCASSHLHKWGSKEFWDTEGKLAEAAFLNGRIKVVCSKGVVYRFLWEQPKAIEIYPGDGSLMRSSGLSGHFFTHFIYSNAKVDERMYSISLPPPDIPGTKYSIGRLIKTGERYLRHLYEESLSGTSELRNCCWKRDPSANQIQEPLPNVLLEECLVPGVGKFTAFSSGRVRIVFSDRTALDMYADFSKRVNKCAEHSEIQGPNTMGDLHSYRQRSESAHVQPSDLLPAGVCKVMLPSGHYQQVLSAQPGQYGKYVQAANEWASWVNCSPEERQEFYRDTLHDPERAGQVDTELRRINCFNYIVEKTILPQFESKNCQREQYMPSDRQMEIAMQLDPSFNCQQLPPSGLNRINPAESGSKERGSLNKQNNLSSYFPNSTKIASQGRGVLNTEVKCLEEANYNLAMVDDILRKTSQAVNDLDKFLKVNGEEQPVRE